MYQGFKKLLCMALVFVMVTGLLPAEVRADDSSPNITASFTCDYFLEAVRATVGIASPAAVRLSYVQNITDLDVSWSNITSLAGIEHFTSLQELSARNTLLTEVNITNHPYIRHIDLWDTQVVSVDVSNNPALQFLSIGALHTLSSVNLSNSPAIEHIELFSYHLTEIDVSDAYNLHTLNTWRVPLSEVDISNNPQLETLVIENARLTGIDVTNNPYLATLNLAGNSLTALDVTQNPRLQFLNLAWGENSVASLDVSNNPYLIEINLAGNSLSELDVTQNPQLQTLNLNWGDNSLTTLDVTNNPYLIELHLAGNNLTELDVTQNPLLQRLSVNWNYMYSYLDITNNPDLVFLNAIRNEFLSTDYILGWENKFQEALYRYDFGEELPATGFLFYPQRDGFSWDDKNAPNPYSLRTCEIIQGYAEGDLMQTNSGRIRFTGAVYTAGTHQGINYIRITEREAAWNAIEISPYNLNVGDVIAARGRVISPTAGMIVQIMAVQRPFESLILGSPCFDTGMFDFEFVLTERFILGEDDFDRQFRNGFRLQIGHWVDEAETYDNHIGGSIADFNIYDLFINPPANWQDLPIPGQPQGDDITYDFTCLVFRDAVRNHAGISSTSRILKSHVENITWLDVSFSDVTGLAGIEHFTSLEVFYAANTPLTEVTITNHPYIQHIYLWDTQVTSVDVSNNPSLQFITIGALHTLSSVNLSNSPALEHIELFSYHLTEIDVSDAYSLRMLHTWRVPLSEADISNNPHLESLVIENARLTGIDVTNNPLLQFVNLSWGSSRIASIDLSNNPYLATLNLAGNSLTALDVTQNPRLQFLNLAWGENSVASLDVANNPYLVEITMPGNSLTELDVTQNPLLQILNLNWGDNSLTTLDVTNNPYLRELHLAGNNLTELDVTQNPLLQRLSVNWNYMYSYLDITNNPDLVFLNAIRNEFRNPDYILGWEDLFPEALYRYDFGEELPATGFLFYPQREDWAWENENAENPYSLRDCEIMQGYAESDRMTTTADRIRFTGAVYIAGTHQGVNYLRITGREAAWEAIEISPHNLNAGDVIAARGRIIDPIEGAEVQLVASARPWEAIERIIPCPTTGMFDFEFILSERHIIGEDDFDRQFRNGFRLQIGHVVNEEPLEYDNFGGGSIADFNLYDFFINPPTDWQSLPFPGQEDGEYPPVEIPADGVHFPDPQNNDGFSTANANPGQSTNLHLNVVRLNAPQNATYRVEWLRNGVVFSTDTFNMPNNRERRISLQLQNVTHATHSGDWQARVFTIVNGEDVFADISPIFVLSVSTPQQGGGNGGGQPPAQGNQPAPAPAPAPDAPPAAPVTSIPANDGAVQVGVQVQNTQATISMPGNVRNQIRNNADGYVSFNLSEVAGLETAVMARSDWNNFAGAGLGVEIALPVGTLAFDPAAALSIGDLTTGANIASTIAEVGYAALTSDQQNALDDGDMVFRITITANNRYVREFNGNLAITVPFEGTPPVGAWRLADDGTLEQLPATFDAETGTVTFITNRLSMFRIGHDPAATIAIATPIMRVAIGVAFGDAVPFIDGANRTLVPLRAIAEGLGAEVDWDNNTRTVSITRDGQTALVTIDTPLPNGMGTAVIQNDRTFVPIRYVSEVLGTEVRWDESTRAVYIY